MFRSVRAPSSYIPLILQLLLDSLPNMDGMRLCPDGLQIPTIACKHMWVKYLCEVVVIVGGYGTTYMNNIRGLMEQNTWIMRLFMEYFIKCRLVAFKSAQVIAGKLYVVGGESSRRLLRSLCKVLWRISNASRWHSRQHMWSQGSSMWLVAMPPADCFDPAAKSYRWLLNSALSWSSNSTTASRRVGICQVHPGVKVSIRGSCKSPTNHFCPHLGGTSQTFCLYQSTQSQIRWILPERDILTSGAYGLWDVCRVTVVIPTP